jgi:hypothetical protein
MSLWTNLQPIDTSPNLVDEATPLKESIEWIAKGGRRQEQLLQYRPESPTNRDLTGLEGDSGYPKAIRGETACSVISNSISKYNRSQYQIRITRFG